MSLAVPDGWTILSGLWGTDFSYDTSVYASGLGSLKFEATTPATDPQIVSAWIPARDGSLSYSFQPTYVAEILMRASSTAAGNNVTVNLVQYRADRTTVDDTVTLHTGPLNTVNTWKWYGLSSGGSFGSTTRWLRVEITKAKTAFTLNIDRISVRPDSPSIATTTYNAATTPLLVANTWTDIYWTGGIACYANSNATGELYLHRPGRYLMTAQLTFQGSTQASADTIGVRIYDIDLATVISNAWAAIPLASGGITEIASCTATALYHVIISNTYPAYRKFKIQAFILHKYGNIDLRVNGQTVTFIRILD